jgi:hypothetical protein
VEAYLHISQEAYPVLLFTGIGLFLVAPLILVYGWLKWQVKPAPKIYTADLATEDELAELHEFCKGALPEALAPLGVWRQRFEKNPEIIYILRESSTRFRKQTSKVVGSFGLIPLSMAARAAIEREEMTGADLMKEHVVSAKSRPAAIYLSWVLAYGRRARYNVLTLLNLQLRKMSRGQAMTLLTKPATDEGLVLADQYGFKPVNPSKKLAKNTICRYEMIGGAIERRRSTRTWQAAADKPASI